MILSTKKPQYEIPVPSTEFTVEAAIFGQDICFRYLRQGIEFKGGIRFLGISAIRTRAERCCKLWHVEDVYDTLVEIDGSSWVQEIRADTSEQWRDKWEMHHFMIYLDSVGCFEVIARAWQALPEEPTA